MAEARDNVTRLMAHPSLVLWNGNNECVWLAEDDGWEEQLDGRPWGRTWWDEELPVMVGLTDPGRPYWPGSPTSPAWSGAPANDPDHGTMHLWDVWNARDYEAYREHRPRFAAEFGYQGPPAWSTLARAVGRRRADGRTRPSWRTTRRRPTAWRSWHAGSPQHFPAPDRLRRLAVPDAAQPGTSGGAWAWSTCARSGTSAPAPSCGS